MRLLLVDDDPGLRELLGTTFESVRSRARRGRQRRDGRARIAARRPDVIVLDVLMPGIDGDRATPRSSSAIRRTEHIPVVAAHRVGATSSTPRRGGRGRARRASRSARSSCSRVVERLVGGLNGVPLRQSRPVEPKRSSSLLYAQRPPAPARDRARAARAARAARTATRSSRSRARSSRRTRARARTPSACSGTRSSSRGRVDAGAARHDPSIEYGFLLHDVGKIGDPGQRAQKPAPLTPPERRLIEKHTVLGEQMLDGVPFLSAECLSVVRSHHERWDGGGYPDGRRRRRDPAAVRACSPSQTRSTRSRATVRTVARSRGTRAVDEIVAESGKQFDPHVVDVFREREAALRDDPRASRRGLAPRPLLAVDFELTPEQREIQALDARLRARARSSRTRPNGTASTASRARSSRSSPSSG